MPTVSIGTFGDVEDELKKIINNAPYQNGCLLYTSAPRGYSGMVIMTNPCKDSFSANGPNVKYLIGLGNFCILSMDVYFDAYGKSGEQVLWNYVLLYNKQPGGYLNTNEHYGQLKSLAVCP